MKDIYISKSVKYVGVDDKDIDLFESQYMSYLTKRYALWIR